MVWLVSGPRMKLLATKEESLIVKLIVVFSWTCIHRSTCSTRYGDLRISGGGSSGMLEFRQIDGTWGYVCSRGFDSSAARVACQQLGYTSGYYSTELNYASYNDVDDYAICRISCDGYESRLAECSLQLCSQYDYHYYSYYSSCYSAVIISCYGQSSGSSSNTDDNDDDDDNHIYPGVIAGTLFVFIIAGIVIIGIIVIKKKKSIRRSQQTASVAVATPPQASILHYTYPSVSSQAPVSNQSYSNPVYVQQQTPQASTGNEAAMTSVSPRAATFYPRYNGAESAAAVGFTSNQSHLPDGNIPAVNAPTYLACTGERAPDGSTNNQSNLLPPDYASACASVPIPPATNS